MIAAEQLNLRDQVVTRGRRLREDHPWGASERAWQLARKYIRAGVRSGEALRLAALYHQRDVRARLVEDPSLLWAPVERTEREMSSRSAESADRIRIVFKPDCSPLIRKKIQAGQYPGIEWVDGLGGVLEASRRTRKT